MRPRRPGDEYNPNAGLNHRNALANRKQPRTRKDFHSEMDLRHGGGGGLARGMQRCFYLLAEMMRNPPSLPSIRIRGPCGRVTLLLHVPQPCVSMMYAEQS